MSESQDGDGGRARGRGRGGERPTAMYNSTEYPSADFRQRRIGGDRQSFQARRPALSYHSTASPSQRAWPKYPEPDWQGIRRKVPADTASSASISAASTPVTSTSEAAGGVKRAQKELEGPGIAIEKLQIFSKERKGLLCANPTEIVIRRAGVDKRGRIGSPITVFTNLFNFNTKKKDAFYHYNAKFNPEPASARFRRSLIKQIEDQAGISKNYVTDGCSLYCTDILDEGRVKNLLATTSTTEYQIRLTHVGCVQANSHVVIHLLNVIFNSYSLYPGFFSSILEYESGTKLMMDVSHKLISTMTVYDVIMSNDVSAVRAKIVGKVVHTRYNDKTYKVEDIHFDKNPMFSFKYRKNEISVFEYYMLRYNIEIGNLEQPLLAIRSKKKEVRAGVPEVIFLVPELCHVTGFSDEIRINSQVMRKFIQHAKLEPSQRVQRITEFAQKITQDPEVEKILRHFGIGMSPELVSTNARRLPKLSYLPRDLMAITRGRLLDPAHLKKWMFIYPSNVPGMNRDSIAFLQELRRSCSIMGMEFEWPDMRTYRNVGELQESIRSCPDDENMVFAVIRDDERKYSAFKKLLCLQKPIPSQMVLCPNITNKKPAVVSKIALQLNCKMGGSGWSIANMNVQGTMVVGVDTYHDSDKRTSSFAGIVASLDIKCSKYYTTWLRHDIGQEVLINLRSVMTECLKEYQEFNGRPCERVIIYRDGVGDGQLEQLMKSELQEALGAIEDLGLKNTRMAFVVVKKRVNMRFFAVEGQVYRNPPPGIVIDTEATKPTWMDFYLINQEVRSGSVTPTHFNVVYNSTPLRVDELQLLTYQQCHLYYNWTGPIRVPAVCQYAHKVAYLIGEFLHDCPRDELKRKLFYL